jgi:hypothetical protein
MKLFAPEGCRNPLILLVARLFSAFAGLKKSFSTIGVFCAFYPNWINGPA